MAPLLLFVKLILFDMFLVKLLTKRLSKTNRRSSNLIFKFAQWRAFYGF